MNERTIPICLLHNLCIVYIYCAYRLYTRVAHQLRSRCGHHPIQFERQAHLRAITSQVKAQILSGALAAGAKLPSIRALASDLGVSVITTKRAYADLEQLGFICTVQGKGCFVADGNQELLRENQLCHIEELLAKAASQAETLGVTRDKLHEMLDLVAPETMQ